MNESTSNLDIEDFAALRAYLVRTGRVDQDETLAMLVLAGGVSSRTVLVDRGASGSWVLKQALPKLRVAMDWFSDPLRVHREAMGLRWLERLVPGSVPALVFEDFDQHLFAMQAVAAPHENWKTRLLGGRVELDYVEQFAELLSNIHRQAWHVRDQLPAEFADRSFFESLRIEPYYECSAQLVPEAAVFLGNLIAATRQRQITLVHGDYSPKNVLIHQRRLILLDHEVIHLGDPAFDVGFAMTHLLSKGHYLAEQRERFAAAADLFARTYLSGLKSLPWIEELQRYAVRHTIACLLARVSGRSPLEYLSSDQRTRQRAVVLDLIDREPASLFELVERFLSVF